MNKLRTWLSPVVYLSNNWLSLAGVVLVTASTVTWLAFLPITIRGGALHPYFGLVVYLLLPGIFIGGLLLIPIGIYWNRWRKRAKGQLPAGFPPLDLQSPALRKLIMFVVVTTLLNIVIASQFSYSAVRYMDTASFCGQTCHVMKPEFTAHERSPHSNVECVSCHIGPGASWFVRAKLSGTRQVLGVMLNNYPRPIPAPVHNMRAARETCENCHAAQKFNPDRLRDIPSFSEDEQNSPTHTVLMMHMGGGPSLTGIHGKHLGQGVTVRYFAADDKRQKIPYVEYTSGGSATVYASGDAKPDRSQMREMDCIDCHNRPTHIYQLPNRGVDEAMLNSEISPTLPFAKKQSVAILKQSYATEADAVAQIPRAFEDFYRNNYPQVYAQRRDEITRSGKALLAVFQHNVFPEMKVNWGTYPNNLGHTDFDGCFRCHDEQHAAKDGKTITQDCNACHNLLASDEKNPKILTDLGVLPEGKK